MQDETTDEERLERLDRLEKLRRADRRFDPSLVAYAKKEWHRADQRNYAIYVMVGALFYALARWLF